MFVFEDNFDFNSELLKEDTQTENICLISGLPLDNPVKLSCGHIFNYECIFKDVFNQKINPHFKYDNPLKVDQFRCPYCRKIQKKLLPEGNSKVYKVSTNDPDYEIYPNMYSSSLILCLGKCSYPYCTKKYVFNKKPYKINLCCVHEKISKKDLYRITKINNYSQKYPDETIESIILKINKDEEEMMKKTHEEIITETKQAKEKEKCEKAQAKVEAKAQAKAQAKLLKDEEKAAKAQAKVEAKAQAKILKDAEKAAKAQAKTQAKAAKTQATILQNSST